MKILFLYTRFDTALKIKIAKLQNNGIQVSTLSLNECKLTHKGKTSILDIPTKLEFLEKKSPKLRIINRTLKRKKILSSLSHHDVIDIYKCEKTALLLVDEISAKCTHYIVTLSSEKQNPLAKTLYKHLYHNAQFILLHTHAQKIHIPLKYQEKIKLIYEPVPALEEIDFIADEAVFKASFSMGLDLDEDIIYCDMSGSINLQMRLIDDILALPYKRLQHSTFIFHLNHHDLEERRHIKAHLEGKNFDYLLIESLITPQQSALLYKIADKTLLLSIENNPTFALSLYAKNHTFAYADLKLDPDLQQAGIFLATYDDFKKNTLDDNLFLEDLLGKNRESAYRLFDPQETIAQYIKVLQTP